MGEKPETAELFVANARLNDTEYALQRLHLQSMPRHLTIVLGNQCNLNCIHCYQVKNHDNLLAEPEIGQELRREFASLYPYLSTLRIQGGEVFALRGFQELLEDVEATINRPLISISTNGVLIDDDWARRIVRIPFQSITFSIDGATPATFEKLRRGARFEAVLENIRRVQAAKKSLDSPWPRLDAFYVLMRSNYQEIPQFMELMKSLSIDEVAFQLMLVDNRNLGREPGLAEEMISSREDVLKLHEILRKILARDGRYFHRISWSGMQSLFEQHGIDPSFLEEEIRSLYPGYENLHETESPLAKDEGNAASSRKDQPSVDLPRAAAEKCKGREIKLCPNPWSMLQISENGDASICFLSDPIGNIYEMPLARIWNHPKAIAQRSEMIAGRYLSGGCSKFSCSWREGKVSTSLDAQEWRRMLRVFKEMVRDVRIPPEESGKTDPPRGLAAVRRMLQDKDRRIRELEGIVADLWEKNGYLHNAGQAHIDFLESKNRELASSIADQNVKVDESPQALHLHSRLLNWLSARAAKGMKH